MWTYQLASIKIPVERYLNYVCAKIHNFIQKCTPNYLRAPTNTILYDIGILGLNELDNVHFDLAGILNVFCWFFWCIGGLHWLRRMKKNYSPVLLPITIWSRIWNSPYKAHFNLFTNIHDGYFRRYSSMYATIYDGNSRQIYYISTSTPGFWHTFRPGSQNDVLY